MKPVYFVIILLLSLSACHSVPEMHEINLKDYFNQLDNFENPKVLVYESDSAGVIKNTYYQLEREGNDVLKMIKYDHKFRLTETQDFKFNAEGVIITAASFIEDQRNPVLSPVIIDSIIAFSFVDPEKKMVNKSYFTVHNDSVKIMNDAWWIMDTVVEKEINGEQKLVILGSGVSTRTTIIPGKTYVENVELSYWFAEGMGLVKVQAKFRDFTYAERYIKTLSLKEFNDLIN